MYHCIMIVCVLLSLIVDFVPCTIVGNQIDQSELVDISTYGKLYQYSIKRNNFSGIPLAVS